MGIGGTTGHVVVEGPPPHQSQGDGRHLQEHKGEDDGVLCIVGGLSPKAADEITQAAISCSDDDTRNLAVVLARRARQLPWRTYFTLPWMPGTVIPKPVLVPSVPPPVAFVFSGQGPQHLHMGRQLFASNPIFRDSILETDEVHRRVTGTSLIETTGLFSGDGSKATLPALGWPADVTLPAIAMVQLALFDLFDAMGIRADLLVGHSAGETAILYASGAGPKAMAMEIAIARGKSLAISEKVDGGMAALACNKQRAHELISKVKRDQNGGVLDIACYNAPESVTLSGSSLLVDEAIALAKSENIFAARVRTMVPAHSTYMDIIHDDYNDKMFAIFDRYAGDHRPRIPVFSTCTGEVLVDKFTAEYFWDNARKPVLFTDAVTRLLASETAASVSPIFVEISPHPVLSSSVTAHGVLDANVLCPMRRPTSAELKAGTYSEHAFLNDALGQLSLLGLNSLDLTGLYGSTISKYEASSIRHPLVARTIPVNKTYLSSSSTRSNSKTSGPLTAPMRLNGKTHPTLAQHVINQEPILPATGFIELVSEHVS